MSALRGFWNNVIGPSSSTTDDGGDGAAVASPAVSDSPAQADPPPVVLADNVPPPAHDDPLVGQNKPIDPNDRGAGVTGTWDFNKPPKVTGGYVDPGYGDPLKYPPDKDDSAGGGSGPSFGGPPPGSTPPGPGYRWDPILQGWRKDKAPDAGSSTPAPQPDPRGPGDYEVPGGDSAMA